MTARRIRRPASTDLVGIGLLAGPAGLAFIGIGDLAAMITGLNAGTERIELSSHAPAALAAAIGLAAFATMLFQRKGTPRGDTRLMGLALACIPLMLLLPIPYLLAGRAVLTSHGYRQCDTGIDGRRAVYRWYRSATGPCR